MTSGKQPEGVSEATAKLVTSLRQVAAIEGVRIGLRHTITFTESQIDPANPSHFEAMDVLPFYRALLKLVEAVQHDKGGSP